jgi:hypothetical protein
MIFVENSKPKVAAKMIAMREGGASFETIATYASKALGLPIGREMVRRWLKIKEEEAARLWQEREAHQALAEYETSPEFFAETAENETLPAEAVGENGDDELG